MFSLVYVDSESNPETSAALYYARKLSKTGRTVIVLGIGDESLRPKLASFTEFGADKAYLVTGEDVACGDVITHARIIRAFLDLVEDEHLVFFDKIHGQDSVLPSVLSGILDSQQFLYVKTMNSEDGIQCISEYGMEERLSDVPSDSVVQFLQYSNINNRIADAGSVETLDRVVLGLGRFSVGIAGSKTDRKC